MYCSSNLVFRPSLASNEVVQLNRTRYVQIALQIPFLTAGYCRIYKRLTYAERVSMTRTGVTAVPLSRRDDSSTLLDDDRRS